MVSDLEDYRAAGGQSNAFGIYVHVPFCVHKCSYCDFYSFTKYDNSFFEKFTDRVCHELDSAANWLEAKKRDASPAISIFIGGGTPSLLPVACYERIFQTIERRFAIAPDAEITTEANPETVTGELLTELSRRTPINRVSLGAQSFDASNLQKLERLAGRDSIHRAVGLLKAAGFSNFNLDLIFGIPGQGRDGMLADIREAVSLAPKHLSFYNLTLKPGHTLFKELPSDDDSADLYVEGIRLLASNGYAQYEISNFAQVGFESRHNSLYWDGGDFLGVGPSAASRFFWDGVFHHRKQLSDYAKYVAEVDFPAPGFEATDRDQTILEATFLEMRKNVGLSLDEFHRRYGWDLRQSPRYDTFKNEGMIEEAAGWLRLTPRGRLLADTVTRDLAP